MKCVYKSKYKNFSEMPQVTLKGSQLKSHD